MIWFTSSSVRPNSRSRVSQRMLRRSPSIRLLSMLTPSRVRFAAAVTKTLSPEGAVYEPPSSTR